MESRIKKVMSEVLGIAETVVSDNTSPETIASWDSLKQMNLIVALEEEFEIEFTDEEIVIANNFEVINRIIKQKIDA